MTTPTDPDTMTTFLADPVFQRGIEAEGRVLDFLIELRKRMEHAGVTEAQVAERIGVSVVQVRRWLKAEMRLPARALFLLAFGAGFDVRVGWDEKEGM